MKQENKNPTRVKKAINRLIVIIGLGLLFHVIYLSYGNQDELSSLFKKMNWIAIFPITFFAMLPTFFHTLRIMLWSNFVGKSLNFRSAIKVVMTNDIGSAAAPNLVGGGPFKYWKLTHYGIGANDAGFIVLLSSIEDLIFYSCGILLILFAFPANYFGEISFQGFKYFLLIFFMAISCLIFFNETTKRIIYQLLNLLPQTFAEKCLKIAKRLNGFLIDMAAVLLKIIKVGKLRFLLSLVMLFCQWFSRFTILAVVLYFLGLNFNFLNLIINQWAILISILVVPLPGGSGGAEVGFFYVFKNIFSQDVISIMVSVWRFFGYYYLLIVTIILNFFIKEKTLNEDK